MPTTSPDLTVSISCQDGSCTECYQDDQESIRRILDLLLTPRVFSQPLLIIGSQRGVSSFASRTIDVIRIQTPTPLQLGLPPGFEDIAEIGSDAFASAISGFKRGDDECAEAATPGFSSVSLLELHTTGAWVILLRSRSSTTGTIQDQRLALTRFFDPPMVPFRLEGGGMGIVNPANISRMTMYPGYAAAPQTALPMDLLRWTPKITRERDCAAL